MTLHFLQYVVRKTTTYVWCVTYWSFSFFQLRRCSAVSSHTLIICAFMKIQTTITLQ